MSDTEVKNSGDDLAKVFDVPKVFTLSDGRDVVISKSKLRNLTRIINFAQRVISSLTSAGVIGVSGTGLSVAVNNPSVILQLIAEFSDEFYSIAQLHVSLSLDELMDIDTDDAVLLFIEIINYNKHFFVQRVAPLLKLQ
jgi:hypothetical protein